MSSIVAPPAAKKRKRTWTSYSEFLDIIQRLGSKYDPLLFACLEYKSNIGVICNTCSVKHPAYKKIKGPFTNDCPMPSFSFTTFKDHVMTDKHYKRIQDDNIRALHPKSKMNKNQHQSAVISTMTPITEFDQIINAIKLIHIHCKTSMAETVVEIINNFIYNNCNEAITENMGKNYHITEVLNAMNQHQIICDDEALLGKHRNGYIALAFDGSTSRARDMKIFFGKACQKGVGPVTKYVEGLDPQKNVLDVDINLGDLLTIDTGKDNVRIIEKVIQDRLKIKWPQLIQLAVDGASNNMGPIKGCATTVRFVSTTDPNFSAWLVSKNHATIFNFYKRDCVQSQFPQDSLFL